MPAYDNVQLQGPPQAPSYQAPQIGLALGQMLGSLPQDYPQAQQTGGRSSATNLRIPTARPAGAATAGIDPNSLGGISPPRRGRRDADRAEAVAAADLFTDHGR